MSDVRALVPGTPRLPVPHWTVPQPGEFVRGFGPLEPRRGGAFADESYDASARQAIKLPNLERASLALERLGAACAFRRLSCDGVSLARVEVGLQVGSRSRPSKTAAPPSDRANGQAPLQSVELDQLMASVLDLPVRVRSLDAPEKSSALYLSGPPLARLFAQATTATGTPETHTLVRAVAPALLIEYQLSDIGDLPGDARVIDPTSTGGVPLAFLWREHRGRMIGTWLLGVGRAEPQVERDLRLLLLRVHADHAALRHVIALMLDGTITYNQGTEEGERLAQYLNRVTTAIPESYPRAAPAKAIANVLYACGEPIPAAQRALVVQSLRPGRPQIVAKVNRYLETAEQARVNAAADTPIRVFVSYSGLDRDYVRVGSSKSILEYLKGLQREGFIFWHDQELYASQIWDTRIRQEMVRADVALLLVSQHFLNSDYITNTELPALLAARQTAGMSILPLMVSVSEWESYPWLAAAQHLPRQGTLRQQYAARGKREAIYQEVFKALRQIGTAKRNKAPTPRVGV
jgi:TIR domain